MNQIIFFIACGKITKNVTDEDNHIISGNWFMSTSFNDEDKEVKNVFKICWAWYSKLNIL